jgi:hypothetical protein
MADDSFTKSAPQFSTAEYAAQPGVDRCRTCSQPIVGSYYRVNGALTCPGCARLAEASLPKDRHAAFVRGVLFGVGGAILGLILYAAFGIITGLVIGYVSLAVGYIVGKAIKLGSRGMGGRRYQIAAAILTYAAVSMAAVPMGVAQYIKAHPRGEATSESVQAPSADDAADVQQTPARAKPAFGVGQALLGLAILGLGSPFLALQEPLQGLIGLVILFVGIRIAWKLTAGTSMSVDGPFDSSRPTATFTGRQITAD